MLDERGLLSQQEPPAAPGGGAAGFPQAVAVVAPPAAAPAPAYGAPAAAPPMVTGGPAVFATPPPPAPPTVAPGVGAPGAATGPYAPPMTDVQFAPRFHGTPQQAQLHQQQLEQQQQMQLQQQQQQAGMQMANQQGFGTKPQPRVVTKPPYQDVVFMVIFLIHVGLILLLAFALGAPALSSDNEEAAAVKDDVSAAHPIVGLLVVTAIIGGILSALWVTFLHRNAKSIIKCTLYTSVVVELIIAVATMFVSPAAGVIFLLIALFTMYYVYLVRNRIPFASANLSAACAAVERYPNVLWAACAAVVVQVAWIALWALAFFGVEANSLGDGYICEFLMLCSFFWGLFVVKNVVHCTTAGSVGSWWFVAAPQSPVWGALRRACTTSFGSICFGSLIVAVLSALRAMINSARRGARGRRGGGLALACAACFVRCVERLMEYFNHWAFVQVALYGKDFRTAGGDALRIFKERGWTQIINDNLISRALILGCFMVGTVTSVVGAGWAASSDDDSGYVFAAAFLGFLIGFGMCMIVSSVIDSAVATVFVCFAEHPDALAATHPSHLNALVQAWQTFHPQAFARAGYDVRFARPGVGAV